MNRQIKSKEKGTLAIQYPSAVEVSKELERTSGVDMVLYLHAPRSWTEAQDHNIMSDKKSISSEKKMLASTCICVESTADPQRGLSISAGRYDVCPNPIDDSRTKGRHPLAITI